MKAFLGGGFRRTLAPPATGLALSSASLSGSDRKGRREGRSGRNHARSASEVGSTHTPRSAFTALFEVPFTLSLSKGGESDIGNRSC